MLRRPDRLALVIVLEGILSTLLAFVLGQRFTGLFHHGSAMIGGLWAGISAVVVLQGTLRDTRKAALLRVASTFVGALVCAIYLWLFPFSIVGIALCVGVTILICHVFNIFEYARLACAAVLVIAVVSQETPGVSPFLNAFLRFMEATIGVAVTVGTVFVLHRFARRTAASGL